MGRHSAPTSRHRAEVIKTPVAVHLKRAGVVLSGAMALALVGSTATAPTGTLTALSGAPAQVIWKADPTPRLNASGQVIGTERTLVRQVSEDKPLVTETEVPAPATKEVEVPATKEVEVPVVEVTPAPVPTTPAPKPTTTTPKPTPEATPDPTTKPTPEPENGCT